MRSLSGWNYLVDHGDLLSKRLVLSSHAGKCFTKEATLLLLALRTAMQVGKLRLQLHRILFFALAKTSLCVAILFFASSDLTKAFGIEYLVLVPR